jgi:hypothetical protein
MERISWMLGMTQNMMNIAEQNMQMDMMNEMYAMTSVMMGNLNYMNLMSHMLDTTMLDMMEPMMRSLEQMMMNVNMEDKPQKEMIKNMMQYMIWMQMFMITKMQKK